MAGPGATLVSPQGGEQQAGGAHLPKAPFWDPAPGASYVQYAKPGPWESVQLAGVELPGICRVRSAKGRKATRTAGPGDEEEQITDTGAESSEVTISCLMWVPEHLALWEDLLEAVQMKGGSRADPEAVDVVHPGLNAAGISSLYVLVITIPERGGVSGSMEFAIQATEFKPAAKKSTKKKATPTLIEASTSPIPLAIDPTKPSPSTTESGP